MAEDTKELDNEKWPKELINGDDLYAIVGDNGIVQYIVFASAEKKETLVRDNSSWVRVRETFFENVDDPSFYNEDVDLSFVDAYDKAMADGKEIVIPGFDEDEAVTAAAEPEQCPPATQDIKINLRNRLRAIRSANYGPLNPKDKNTDFWEMKAELWSTSVDEAKKSLCGNCAVFNIKKSMLDCIASGIEQGGSASQSAWDAIDQAELGYCDAFDFKCAASRTCDAWVVGGPISDKKDS
jgi:hypothetical protein